MGRIMHLNRIPQSHYVQRAPSPSPPQPFDLRSLAQGVIPSESVKKSGVRMSQADINLRPYPSSDGSCELFYAPYARGSPTPDPRLFGALPYGVGLGRSCNSRWSPDCVGL